MGPWKLVSLFLLSLAFPSLIAADAKTPASSPASDPASTQPASRPVAEVYTAWPFDAKEAARRQDETAKALGVPKETTLDLGNKAKMKLVLIPAGTFTMGNSKEEQGRGENESEHEVAISKPFHLGIYDVTQEQYEQVMGKNPSSFKGGSHPVDQVSWGDAMEFCKKLSQKTGKSVTLPTEAQWEYACRAGTRTLFNTGTNTISTDQANYDARKTRKVGMAPVGTFKPNAWGLYDMHGNAWQWCADWYQYHGGYYARSPKTDPQGPSAGTVRVLRGGSCGNSQWGCLSSYRFTSRPDYRGCYIGFRVVVLDAKTPASEPADGPASTQSTSSPVAEVYTAWPSGAKEERSKQGETAKTLGIMPDHFDANIIGLANPTTDGTIRGTWLYELYVGGNEGGEFIAERR